MPGSYNPPVRRHTTDSPSLSKPIYLVNTPTGVRPRDAPDSSDCKPIDPPLLTAPSTFSRAPTMLQRRRSYEASLAPSDSISQVSERRYQKQQQSHQRHYSSQQSPSYSHGGGRGANVIVLDSKGRMLPQRGQTYHSYVPQSQPSSPADSRGRVIYLQSGGGKHTRSQSVPRNASSGQRYYYTESPPRASSPASPTKYVINGRTYTVMPSQSSRNHLAGSHSTSGSSASKESMGHRIRRLLGMNSGSSASGGRRHTPPPNSSSRFIQW